MESYFRRILDVVADVLRQYDDYRPFSFRRPPEHFGPRFPARVSRWRFTAICMGTGYRSIHDKNDASFTVSLQPNQVTLNQFTTFLQDEISLVDNRLHITLGPKFERTDY